MLSVPRGNHRKLTDGKSEVRVQALQFAAHSAVIIGFALNLSLRPRQCWSAEPEEVQLLPLALAKLHEVTMALPEGSQAKTHVGSKDARWAFTYMRSL